MQFDPITFAAVQQKGNLKYQIFTSSGTFTPSARLLSNGGQCWVRVVGGGGGGGSGATTISQPGGGGGGSGQCLETPT